MRIHQEILTIEGSPRRLVNITERVAAVVAASQVRAGLCTLLCRHTSASLCIQENADPAVLRDLARFLERLAPEGADYEHDDEGQDDMPAHLRTLLTRTSENIPILDGKLALGTWQGIYLWEHRARPRLREVVVHVAGQ